MRLSSHYVMDIALCSMSSNGQGLEQGVHTKRTNSVGALAFGREALVY